MIYSYIILLSSLFIIGLNQSIGTENQQGTTDHFIGDKSSLASSPHVFDSFPNERSEATMYFAYNIGNISHSHYVYSYKKGLSFLPPPHIHKMISRKIIQMEYNDLRETVNELVDDVKRTESALSQIDNALVVQINKMGEAEKAYNIIQKKMDKSELIVEDMKTSLSDMKNKFDALSKVVIAEWEQIGNIRVKVHGSSKTWDEALSHCKIYSATLVHIDNEDVNRKLSDLIQYESSPMFWIGIEGREHIERLPFHRFAKPSRVCIALEKGGSWLSRPCTDKFPFICGYIDTTTNNIN